MAEIRPLTDFFNPMQTGMQAMNIMNQQDQIAIQQQRANQEQQQIAQQQKMGQLTSIATAMKESPIDAQYPLLKQYAEVAGIPINLLPSQNAFIADPQVYRDYVLAPPGSQAQKELGDKLKRMHPQALAESQKLAGPALKVESGRALRKAAGGQGEDPGLDYAYSEDGPLQTAAAKSLYPDEKEKQLINQRAMINVEAENILGTKNAARAELEEATPFWEQYETYKQTTAPKERQALAEKQDLIPGFSEYDQKRLEKIPKVKQYIEQVKNIRRDIATNLERLSMGLPMTGSMEGKTPEVADASARSLDRVIQLNEARLNFLMDPGNSSYQRYVAEQQSLEKRAADLRQTHENIEQIKLADAQSKEQRAEVEKRMLGEASQKYAAGLAKLGPSPTDAAMAKLGADVLEQYPGTGMKVQDLIPNFHNKPGVEIKMPGTTEEAGKFSMMTNAVKNVQDVKSAIVNKNGSVNRDLVFQSFTNLPFSEGRDINSMIEDAISAKLRAETGAAANAEEVKSISRRFSPSSFDKDSVIVSKLNRLERFLQTTINVRDPSGQIRQTMVGGQVGTPRAGAVQGGYRFKGGDPAKESNWEKVQ